MTITKDILRRILDYDSTTGVFKWKVAKGRARAGDVAGYIANDNRGYRWRQIRVNGVLYPAHRLAWLHYYGGLPTEHIDHINQDATDNRIENLRLVDNKENAKNQSMHSNNTSGATGVYLDSYTGRWKAEVKVDGKKHSVGRFDHILEAHKAVTAFREENGFSRLHGATKLREASNGC